MTNEQINTLTKFVNHNSFTWNKKGVDQMGQLVKVELAGLPLSWEVTSSEKKGDLLLAKSKKWDDNKPTILLCGHLDTVFKKNWPISIVGDKFYGPGVMDMKTGLLVIIETLRELDRAGSLENIMVMFTPDEEDGMMHIDKQMDYYQQTDYALVYEESTLNHKDPKTTERGVVVKRKALDFFNIDFYSDGGHQANIEDEENRHSAINELARKVLELEKLADYKLGTLINTGTIMGGISPNSIAEHASMRVDIRYGNKDEYLRIAKHLKNVFTPIDEGVKIKSKRTLHCPSFDNTAKNEELADKVIAIGKELDITIEKQYRSAGSEANWITFANPECITLDGLGVIGQGDHSQKEYFLIKSFEISVKISTDIIKEILTK